MNCKRCGGLMRSILLWDGARFTGMPAYRCLICSEILDEVVQANRLVARRSRAPRRRNAPRGARHQHARRISKAIIVYHGIATK
jgi:hypothetical protein